ncbi:hypothetical protein [Piscinibacter koreensis]|uniref:DUF2399 domain-containing protein n=1 Tax=Piscinibacter koreensis TaxID=2742824 RepID=A0A7Y6NQR3_9BURK|nr:hypothetical protein [Schlegelella koreensis]NUZ07602.1 hypothetical protein [Schlegelella koreensis]
MTVASAYGARHIKRERRTADQVNTLDDQILAVLAEDHPQSVRHVFYRMTDPRLAEPVEKSDRGYRHVQHRCVELRRSGRLPYGWLADSTRRGYHVDTFAGKADFLRRVNSIYRADLWADADYYVEVWVESRSIAGVLQDDCRELAVSLYPCGGFSSITLAYEAAEMINSVAEGRDVVILYVGDHDPAGVLIDKSLERELRAHLDPSIEMTFERIGITEEQIRTLNLPTNPRKATDKRSQHVQHAVEAEAMPAATMRALVRQHVESYLPEHALEIARIAEQSERQGLLRLAHALEQKR